LTGSAVASADPDHFFSCDHLCGNQRSRGHLA
jgi:hypothetical protein